MRAGYEGARPTRVIAKYGTFEYALAERYRFEDELGRGAMGTVYRAKDMRLGRPVAIKMLHPALTNELGVARFQSEIRIAAGLHHPNIIGVHDSGEVDGRLFYVMDYLGGETLRDRLKREKQLSVEDALRITEQVAEGLQYAHDHGVVHRDVKPENIILAEGRACIVDFGLAIAIGSVGADRLTKTGLSVGTPQYISPEQASAERDIGPPADQYALACVLYEMLVGEPPFTGPNVRAVVMRHIVEPPVPLRTRRQSSPEAVEVAVMRALEKVPADRFPGTQQFATAIRAPAPAPSRTPATPRRLARSHRALTVSIAGGILTAIIAIIGITLGRSQSAASEAIDDGVRWLTSRTLDTSRIVVFPARRVGQQSIDATFDNRLRDALSRWGGVDIVSDNELTSALQGDVSATTIAGRERTIARSLRAGRYAVATLGVVDSTQRIRVELVDVKGATASRLVNVTTRERPIPDALVEHLAYRMLFASDAAASNERASIGTTSRAAFDAYLRGTVALSTWKLDYADSVFAAAVHHDPQFPQALLKLAQVRAWRRDDSPDVEGLLSRALDAGNRLDTLARAHAIALAMLRAGRYRDACETYRGLVARDSLDFAALLSEGECNRSNRVVVRNVASRSGYSFQGSRNRAIVAVERAFNLLQSVDLCCIARATELLQRPLMTSTTAVRLGVGELPDSNHYGAYPELINDTIAFVPVLERDLTRSPPASHTAAVQQMRIRAFAIAARRVAQFPGNVDALEGLAEALELRGDAAAVDTILRARLLSTAPSQTLRLALSEAWLRIKYALPGNLSELALARDLARSLSARPESATPHDAVLLASAASITGNIHRVAALASRTAMKELPVPVPPDVVAVGQALLAYAALGGPLDSLKATEQRLRTAIDNEVLPSHQAIARQVLIGRPAALSFPVYRFERSGLSVASDPLLAAEAAYERHDVPATRRLLSAIALQRKGVRAADLTLDALYPEAWLWAAVGDTIAALSTLAPTLDAIRSIPTRRLSDPVISGALIQSMMLRAKLEASLGHVSVAKLWARSVLTLSDTLMPFVKSSRGDMRLLIR